MPDAYRNTRRAPTSLESGRTLAPGEQVLADGVNTKVSSHDAALIADGSLIAAAIASDPTLKGEALQDRARELGIQHRATMTADELREAVAAAEAGATTDNDEEEGQ